MTNQRDNPNEIKNVIRRGFDQGETWEPIQTTIEFLGDKGVNGPAAIDCSLVQDQLNERIWLLYSHSSGGIGAFNSWIWTGYDHLFCHDCSRTRYDWSTIRATMVV